MKMIIKVTSDSNGFITNAKTTTLEDIKDSESSEELDHAEEFISAYVGTLLSEL